ncbi:hypothetical protein TRIATDRAFT_307773 [Trichoderma atroviride IMI 206040]|uniref:Uncharacterized protein n=1 Tax=Hypocrea atroviridis (strain ATCC 20476 / IMI 206040) TaxID=452589 RepID=G9NUM0_HYPAI|nr:uncharacterized protein TRIATDRAFT_307773 [Trichoderma atroviride IMI 206040]EHK45746.1 hypothetical protein TRIATDRAFT_307773 [Trichoderma atroviride IMI 206040]
MASDGGSESPAASKQSPPWRRGWSLAVDTAVVVVVVVVGLEYSLAVGGLPPAQGSRPLNFAAAPLNPARAAKLVAAEAPTEGCAEYPAPIAEYKYAQPQSWVQRRACSPGPGQRRVGCNLQQAPSTCAGTSTRGQRGKYGEPADPRLDPLALSHPSRRGSSFFGSPLPLLYFLCFPQRPAAYPIAASFIVHAPCGLIAASRLACNCLALRIRAPALPDSHSGCWRINRTLNFQQPSVSAVSSCSFSAESALSPLLRRSLGRARCCQY